MAATATAATVASGSVSSAIGAKSSTMIATIFSRLGYHYQDYILVALGAPLQSTIGGLLYVVGVIITMVVFITSGRFKMGLWLLLGPGLYLTTILTTVETPGPIWQFGSVTRPTEKVQTEVEYVLRGDGYNDVDRAKVSMLFSMYDDLVSGVIDEIVRVLNTGRRNTDLSFMVRAELAGFMRSMKVDQSPGFKDLMHHAMLRGCRQYVEAARDVYNPVLLEGSQQEALRRANQASERAVGLSRQSIEYIAALKVDYPGLWDIKQTNDRTGRKVLDWLNSLQKVERNPAEWQREYTKALQEVQSNSPYSCQFVWDQVYKGLLRYSKQIVDGALDKGEAAGMNRDELLHDLAKVSVLPQGVVSSPDVLYKVIAQYLFRNEVSNTNIFSFISDYANRDYMKAFQVPAESDMAAVENERMTQKEFSERTKVVYTAASMPYYQGLALYFLAMGFPFFALMLIIPGRQGGFAMWFLLWFWVKSWDVGYAVVMVLDDILWAIFSSAAPAAGDPSNELNSYFEVAFSSLKELDPTFNLQTYYSIIGTALNAVPMISSYLILGSLRGGAGMISAGVQGLSQPMSDAAKTFTGQQHIAGHRAAIDRMDRRYNELAREAGIRGMSLAAMLDSSGHESGLGANNPLTGERVGVGYNEFDKRSWDKMGITSQTMVNIAGVARTASAFLAGVGDGSDLPGTEGLRDGRTSAVNVGSAVTGEAAKHLASGFYNTWGADVGSMGKRASYAIPYDPDVFLTPFAKIMMQGGLQLPANPWVEMVPHEAEWQTEIVKLKAKASMIGAAARWGVKGLDEVSLRRRFSRGEVRGSDAASPGIPGPLENMGRMVPGLAAAATAQHLVWEPLDSGADGTFGSEADRQRKRRKNGKPVDAPGALFPTERSGDLDEHIEPYSDEPQMEDPDSSFWGIPDSAVDGVTNFLFPMGQNQHPLPAHRIPDVGDTENGDQLSSLNKSEGAERAADGSSAPTTDLAFSTTPPERSELDEVGGGGALQQFASLAGGNRSSGGFEPFSTAGGGFTVATAELAPTGLGSPETSAFNAGALGTGATGDGAASSPEMTAFFSPVGSRGGAEVSAFGGGWVSGNDWVSSGVAAASSNGSTPVSPGSSFMDLPAFAGNSENLGATYAGVGNVGGFGDAVTGNTKAAETQLAAWDAAGSGFGGMGSGGFSGDWNFASAAEAGAGEGGLYSDEINRSWTPSRSGQRVVKRTVSRRQPVQVIVHLPEQQSPTVVAANTPKPESGAGGPMMQGGQMMQDGPTDVSTKAEGDKPADQKDPSGKDGSGDLQTAAAEEDPNWAEKVKVEPEKAGVVLGEREEATAKGNDQLEGALRELLGNGTLVQTPLTDTERSTFFEAQLAGNALFKDFSPADLNVYQYQLENGEKGTVMALAQLSSPEGVDTSRFIVADEQLMAHAKFARESLRESGGGEAATGDWFTVSAKDSSGQKNSYGQQSGQQSGAEAVVVNGALLQGGAELLARMEQMEREILAYRSTSGNDSLVA